jgi:phosphoribosylamine--glycine ligase
MEKKALGAAGTKIVVEEFLVGDEASVLAITDGETILILEPVMDHKQVGDGDTGLNTGGMGVYSPVPLLTRRVQRQIEQRILVPAVHALRREEISFRGVLFVGLMMTESGPKVLEFNARFGDPETQALMPLIIENDVCGLLATAASGRVPARWPAAARSAATIVVASKGYPEHAETGAEIRGLDTIDDPDAFVFHAGTRVQDGKVVTAGGRVLGVTAWAPTLSGAVQHAYRVAHGIRIDGAFYRSDIGRRHL